MFSARSSLWSRNPAARRPARSTKLRIDRLEDRCVPANIVVNIAGEDPSPGHGNVSFRDAVVIANSNHQANTITFAPGITTILITDPAPLEISALGQADLTTIDGGGVVILERDGTATAGRVLSVQSGAFAELRGLTITGGNIDGYGAGLYVIEGAGDVGPCYR